MTHEDNGAACAVLNAASLPEQDLALLRLQADLLQQALGRSQMAAERLVERQIVTMPTADEPEFRLKLIRDVIAVNGGAKVGHWGGAKVGQLHRVQGSAWRA